MRNSPHHSKSSRCTPIMDAGRFARPPPMLEFAIVCVVKSTRTQDAAPFACLEAHQPQLAVIPETLSEIS